MSTLFEPIIPAKLDWRQGLPYSILFDDIYFSVENGLEEAKYVFVEGNDLLTRWTNETFASSDQFVIAETGFGSGLNFALTLALWQQYAPKNAQLFYISSEKHPLNRQDIERCVQLWPSLAKEYDILLAHYPVLTPGFHKIAFEELRVHLLLMLGDTLHCYQELLACGDAHLEHQLRGFNIDAWFLDGFAPAKNPEMWQDDFFQVMALLSNQGTTVATFSTAGIVKQGLSSVGFTIKKKKGYGRKREMLTASLEQRFDLKYKPMTPWYCSHAPSTTKKDAMIIGAGLAGCFTAHELAKRGWNVHVFDKALEPGLGASANTQAVLYPQLSAYKAPLTEFFLSAYLYAISQYQKILSHENLGELCGVLELEMDAAFGKKHQSLSNWLTAYPELGKRLTAKEASEIAGVPITAEGLLYPQSGWLDSNRLCHYLITHQRIQFHGNQSIEAIDYEQKHWHVNNHHAPVLIIASGYETKQWRETSLLPLKPISGQMTAILSTQETDKLKLPLCGRGHILPALKGLHHCGASYHLNEETTDIANDDIYNLNRLMQLPLDIHWSDQVVSHWTGVRTTTPDYLPVIGSVPNWAALQTRYQRLSVQSDHYINQTPSYHPGLYVASGFGSRGLTSIPLSAGFLASLINKEPLPISRKLIKALSPARFFIKHLIRLKQ